MKRTLGIIALAAGTLVAASATAQESEPNLIQPFGMGVSVGGGVNGFIDEDVRDFTTTGGSWEARYIIGTRERLAAEGAYIGTANSLDTLGVEDSAMLMSNGIEGVLRVNILTQAWQPYVLAGVGWKHYNVVQTDTNTSDIEDQVDSMTVPMGLGLAYRFSNLFADLRATYKPSFFDDITKSGDSNDALLSTAAAQLNIGFEF